MALLAGIEISRAKFILIFYVEEDAPILYRLTTAWLRLVSISLPTFDNDDENDAAQAKENISETFSI